MAERLTESEVSKSFTEQELRTSEQARIYQKLGDLEDIIEKYGIEDLEQYLQVVREVDKELRYTIQQLHTIIDTIGYDRDTWKRACELACKWFKQTGFIGDQTKVDYLYHQAKKEGK